MSVIGCCCYFFVCNVILLVEIFDTLYQLAQFCMHASAELYIDLQMSTFNIYRCQLALSEAEGGGPGIMSPVADQRGVFQKPYS